MESSTGSAHSNIRLEMSALVQFNICLYLSLSIPRFFLSGLWIDGNRKQWFATSGEAEVYKSVRKQTQNPINYSTDFVQENGIPQAPEAPELPPWLSDAPLTEEEKNVLQSNPSLNQGADEDNTDIANKVAAAASPTQSSSMAT